MQRWFLFMSKFPFYLLATLVPILLACSSIETESVVQIGEQPAITIHTEQEDIESGSLNLQEILKRGEMLFIVPFNTLDGAGRPESTGTGAPRARREFQENFNRISGPDANSCQGCHNMPRVGGGGDNVANVFVVATNRPFVNFDSGSGDEFDELTLSNVGNERNTLGMFGAGYIELLAREMTADLIQIRTTALQEAKKSGEPVNRQLITKGVDFGAIVAHPSGGVDTSQIEGVDEDLIIKPFSQKGALVSIRDFTIEAMNVHHGMQASERFFGGLTDDPNFPFDPDGDEVINELTAGDITAVTLFQATLPVPAFVLPENKEAQQAAKAGFGVFNDIGCNSCHISQLPLENTFFTEPNPWNPPLTYRKSDGSPSYSVNLDSLEVNPSDYGSKTVVWVPAFTDLKRHDMGSILDNEKREQATHLGPTLDNETQERVAQSEQLIQNGLDTLADIPTDEWLTRKLWGFASEPPFLHNGRATLISEAILAHGGEAIESREKFTTLTDRERDTLIEFLKTLQIVPEGSNHPTSLKTAFDLP